MTESFSPPEKILKHGDLVIDLYAARVTKGNEELSLSAREYKLLLLFAKNIGELITLDEIMAAFWGYKDSFSEHVVYIAISRIRKKVEDDPKNPKHVITMKNKGYIMPNLPQA